MNDKPNDSSPAPPSSSQPNPFIATPPGNPKEQHPPPSPNEVALSGAAPANLEPVVPKEEKLQELRALGPSDLTAETWRRRLAVIVALGAAAPLGLICLFVYWIADQPFSWERLVGRAVTIVSLAALSAFLFSLVEKLTRPLWLIEKLAALRTTTPTNTKQKEFLIFAREFMQLVKEGRDVLGLGDGGAHAKSDEPKK